MDVPPSDLNDSPIGTNLGAMLHGLRHDGRFTVHVYPLSLRPTSL